MLVFDERHQVHVVIAPNYEDALASVTAGVRMFQDDEQIAPLDVEDDVLEPDAALRPELRVLRGVPVEVLHRRSGYHDVCLIGTPWLQQQLADCGRNCAQSSPRETSKPPVGRNN